MNLPEHIRLANTPTSIERLDKVSAQLNGPTIYIKRDDQTGSEVSGNKVRKLEFSDCFLRKIYFYLSNHRLYNIRAKYLHFLIFP